MKRAHLEAILVTALFLFTLWLWSLPYQENQMPYGEVDAGSHFALGDYMAQTDKSIVNLPHYIDMRYNRDNFYENGKLWYHPPYHVNFALMEITGGERVLPIFLLNTILCSIVVIIIFFVIRNMFGFWPGFLTALLIVFSMRDIMIYLWGQWPQQISYFYTPLVLYAFYKYADSYLNKEPKAVYAYVFAILLGINFWLHPVGCFHTIAALGFFSLFLLIREKKIPFSMKQISICILIFIIMIAIFPLQTASVFVQMKGGSAEDKEASPLYHDFGGLFSWFPWKDVYAFEYKTQPEPYFYYKDMNGGWWTFPFLIAGLAFLFLRRKREDLMLLGFLAGLYFMIHIAILGPGRPERSLAASAHIFYPIIALGVVMLPSLINNFIKMPKKVMKILKYSLITIFIICVFAFNFSPAYSQLKDAYQGIIRITPSQYEASEWLMDNIPESANVSTVGILMMQKERWMRFVGMRYIHGYKPEPPTPDYLLFDYSDWILIGDNGKLNEIAAFEDNVTGSKIYDKNNIKVYKLEG